MAKLSAWWTIAAPGRSVTFWPPALTRCGSSWPGSDERPVADHAVLGVIDDLGVADVGVGAQRRHADAEIDDPAVLELQRQPVGHLLARQALVVAHRFTSRGGGCQDAVGRRRDLHQAMHEDAGRVHVRRDRSRPTGTIVLLDLDDGDLARPSP